MCKEQCLHICNHMWTHRRCVYDLKKIALTTHLIWPLSDRPSDRRELWKKGKPLARDSAWLGLGYDWGSELTRKMDSLLQTRYSLFMVNDCFKSTLEHWIKWELLHSLPACCDVTHIFVTFFGKTDAFPFMQQNHLQSVYIRLNGCYKRLNGYLIRFKKLYLFNALTKTF